jgi:hypothetical protein
MGPLPRVSNRSVMCLQSVHVTFSLGRFKKVTGTPCEQRTLYLGRFARVSLIRCVQRTFNTNHMVNVCKSSLKMNHREDWAMISHLLCGHMTRLLETRGNGPMFTLRTHDPSIGSTWQRSHVHFVDTWIVPSKGSFVHKVSLWPFWIVPRKGSLVHTCLCDLCEWSQVKGPLFTRCLCELCKSSQVIGLCSQGVHVTFSNRPKERVLCSQGVYVTFENRPK